MFLKSKVFTFSLCTVLIVLIIIFPEISGNGVSKGLILSSNVIIPSLFPFMVCVLIILKCGINVTNRLLNKITYTIFGVNFNMFFVFILSLLGGYPVGAKLINELYENNLITEKDANLMLVFCVNAGPAFVIFVVGIGIFNSRTLGILLFVSHIMASFVIALFCGKIFKKNKYDYIIKVYNKVDKISDIFVQSVADTCSAIIKVCSFVVLFSVINTYLEFLFNDLIILNKISLLTEVTYAITKNKNIYFISFILGFSCFSIWCQIFSVCSKFKIFYLQFIFGRLLHGLLSMIFTKNFLIFFNINVPVFNNINFSGKFFYTTPQLFFSMLIMLIVLFCYVYSKNNSGKILSDVI